MTKMQVFVYFSIQYQSDAQLTHSLELYQMLETPTEIITIDYSFQKDYSNGQYLSYLNAC